VQNITTQIVPQNFHQNFSTLGRPTIESRDLRNCTQCSPDNYERGVSIQGHFYQNTWYLNYAQILHFQPLSIPSTRFVGLVRVEPYVLFAVAAVVLSELIGDFDFGWSYRHWWEFLTRRNTGIQWRRITKRKPGLQSWIRCINAASLANQWKTLNFVKPIATARKFQHSSPLRGDSGSRSERTTKRKFGLQSSLALLHA
jgi:hypothetical protein